MIINLVYDQQSLNAPSSFRAGMQQAADTIDAAFRDNITINIAVGYGEFLQGNLPNQNTSEGNIDLNGNNGQGFFPTYSTLRGLLVSHATSADDQTAVNNLPNTTTLQNQSNFIVGSAQWKALGQLAGNASGLDGAVGMGTNFTGSVLFNGALHELTHAMGRIAGTSLDLFRFNEDNSLNHVFGGNIPATPAYFSIDGGHTNLGDFGKNSDPGDFLNGGVQDGGSSNQNLQDPFDETVGLKGLSAVDLTMMDVLGFTRTNAGSPPIGPAIPDFFGDHKSDVLFQNTGGQVYAWDMVGNGLQIGPAGFVSNNSDPSWHVVSFGDYNGDGKSDVLWQNDNGNIYQFDMSGLQTSNVGFVGANSDPSWHIASGKGDFNGDGKSDILFQNTNGQLYEWQLNGTNIGGAGFVGNNNDPSWHVAGVGDFNGDGKSDILWQNDNGQLYMWEMVGNGLQIGPSGFIGNNNDPSWHVTGVGDFNGDGKSDILWQNDNGQVYEWAMNGLSISGSGFVGNNSDPSWHVKGTGDYNGDGKSDILWQNNNGQLYEWALNGLSITGSGFVGNNSDPTWQVVKDH